MDHFTSLLQQTAFAVGAAANACRAWECGANPDPVADTAWEADGAAADALEMLAGIEPALTRQTYPESRLARLVIAARLLVLAGTDEGGQSQDLEIAAQLFRSAADTT